MATSFDKPTLEVLPDEILLEVCKYLLCVDILQAFFGLNFRMTCMISQYYQHMSLDKVSITQSSYLFTNVLPKIGSCIQSLFIDGCYSVLQKDLFIKHFGKNMSIIFPNLKKINLAGVESNDLITFLDTLHNLNNLVEIRLDYFYSIDESQQSTLLHLLLKSNNSRLTSVFINDETDYLSFNGIDCYPNILQLRLKMKEIKEIPSLFAAVPNIQYLDVIFEQDDSETVIFDEMCILSPRHLINFRLTSTKRSWQLEELLMILRHLANVQNLSLCLCTNDSNLVHGSILLPLLPTAVQQFNYAIYYFPGFELAEDKEIIGSWPSSHPITCFSSDTVWFIHTLPWQFDYMLVLSSFGKIMCSQTIHGANYDRTVEHLEIQTNNNFTSRKYLGIIAYCRRIKTLSIWMYAESGAVEEEQRPSSSLPTLSRLIQLRFYPSLTADVDHLSSILIAAPNLLHLDLPSDCLIRLLENELISHLVGQKIISLNISSATASSQLTLTEEHIFLIASNFISVRDLYVDLRYLSPSSAITSNETTSLSMESMLLCLLSRFQQNKIISLCVSIQPSEQIKTDAKQWLQDNTILSEQQFDAKFYAESKQLMIWM